MASGSTSSRPASACTCTRRTTIAGRNGTSSSHCRGQDGLWRVRQRRGHTLKTCWPTLIRWLFWVLAAASPPACGTTFAAAGLSSSSASRTWRTTWSAGSDAGPPLRLPTVSDHCPSEMQPGPQRSWPLEAVVSASPRSSRRRRCAARSSLASPGGRRGQLPDPARGAPPPATPVSTRTRAQSLSALRSGSQLKIAVASSSARASRARQVHWGSPRTLL